MQTARLATAGLGHPRRLPAADRRLPDAQAAAASHQQPHRIPPPKVGTPKSSVGRAAPTHAAPGVRRSVQSRSIPFRRASASRVAAAADAAHDLPRGEQAADKPRAVLMLACVAMALAAVHRVAFSVLALPIQAEFGFSLPQMGMLQSALLVGYVLGQIPSGVLADRIGGAHLAAAGLFLWSFACTQFSQVPGSTQPFMALLIARAVLGLCQSVIMPAASALAARWFPAASRSRYTSLVYSCYSFGTVAGLAATPLVAERVGWASTFSIFGLAGMAAAAIGSLTLPSEKRPTVTHAPQQQVVPAAMPAEQSLAGGTASRGRLSKETLAHLLVLCLTHTVISWAFFIMQSWIPTLLASLGLTRLSSIGILSALPWLATAAVSMLAGSLADRLQVQQGWSALKVRHVMQTAACIGTAVSLLPLAVPGWHLAPAAAVAAITLAVAWQGCCYAGFHSYVGDVAAKDAGLVLAITNTCGTLVGIGGNVLTGYLAASQWGYTGVFQLTMLLQVITAAAWLAGATGHRLHLTAHS